MRSDSLFEHVSDQILSLKKEHGNSTLKLLLSVSGGVDSMVLLEILYRIAHSNPADVQIGVFHLEHGIREEADADYRLVMSYCEERGILFYGYHRDMPKIADERGLSVETASRNMRYNLLFLEYESKGYDYVLTAHHSDDNAESIFMNMARGSGLRGLCGMFSRRGRMVRPLLECSKSDILQYARERGVPYREDYTNLENEYSRNKIRNLVFPYLNDVLGVDFSQKLLSSSKLLKYEFKENKRKADEFIRRNFRFYEAAWEYRSKNALKRIFPEEIGAQEYLERFFDTDAMYEPHGLRFLCGHIRNVKNRVLLIDRKSYCDEDYTIASQILYEIFESFNFNKVDVDSSNIEIIDEFIRSGQPGKIRVYKDVMFELSTNQVMIMSESSYLQCTGPYCMSVNTGVNRIERSDYALSVDILSGEEVKEALAHHGDEDVLLLDICHLEDIVTGRMKLRNRREFDAINPVDMPTSTKKIKKIMNELKLNSLQKNLQPLLCIENKVLWLVGKRKSNRHIFKSNLEKILRIKLVIEK